MSFRAILHVQEVFQMRLSIREKDGLGDHAEFFSTLKELVLHFFVKLVEETATTAADFFVATENFVVCTTGVNSLIWKFHSPDKMNVAQNVSFAKLYIKQIWVFPQSHHIPMLLRKLLI